MTNKYRDFEVLVNEHLTENKNEADKYLELAFKEYDKTGDEKVLLIALKQVAKAKGGFSELSKKTGLSRESLYKTLSEKGNPKLHTFKAILDALGYHFTVQHIE
ncbi:MAG: putative addiction module antidote protein [bacterium]|nr:putative addiction module antidote protein [bacterium]